ncbi:MAG: CvpA family protein [Clostridiales Family XIII bacterium]|jgi:uncharacterized membrane protein required for colicin V production|nr:CvpA family protein [Clostridiales Family XIII bacterium]
MIVIVVACAVFGFRSGFLISLSRIGGWIGAVAVAFFFHEKVEAWVLEHTKFFDSVHDRILQVCLSFVDRYTGGVTGSLPGDFGSALDNIGGALASEAAGKITDHAFTVFVFVGIIIGIKLILFVLTLLLSRKYHDGFIGGVDGFVGLLFGLFQSIIAILVLFALLMPLSYTMSANAHDFVEREMDESVVAELIYRNNPILDVINGFIPADLNPNRWLNKGDYNDVPDWG